jgi:two-component system nitrate/nitrite response regulator NarL
MLTNVLVCHPGGLVADAIRSFLTEQGFRVDLARTVDEMLERARGAGACLVEMDMTDARLGIQRIVAMPAAPRVLALVSREAQIAAAFEAGADACVASADGLDRLVHLLRCEIVLSPRVSSDAAQREFNRLRTSNSGPRLTAREIEVVTGLIHGESTKALAERLRVRPATARTHVQHLLAKLGVHSRLQAVAFVIDNPIDVTLHWSEDVGDDFIAEDRQSAS